MDNDSIEKLIKMTDSEISNYFAEFEDYKPVDELYLKLRHEIDDLRAELRPYEDAKEAAEKINATLFLPKGKNKWFDNKQAILDLLLNIERLYYTDIVKRKENCKHNFVQSGCSGYDREIDVYTCTKCGKKEYR